MNYRIFFLVFFFLLNSCIEYPIDINKNKDFTEDTKKSFFLNKGFTLIYSDDLKNNNLVNKKLNERDLLIFQRNLKVNTNVKITNLLNNRSILAKVGPSIAYPNFYNSVISKRIANELDITFKEPYIEIKELINNSSFIAKSTKTFDEEKYVASKAPVDEITVSSLSKQAKTKIKIKKRKFSYIIKIADFYFKDTAINMVSRIKKETSLKKVSIDNLSKTKYRVFLGPFNNINFLETAFNGIKILEFENIEIIRND